MKDIINYCTNQQAQNTTFLFEKKDGGLYIWEEDWYTIYDPHYSFGK